MPRHSVKTFVLLACFFLSGFCGLVYQIVWMRMIGHVFGNSVFATATVLAAFMGGLALGSYAGGMVADRREDRVKLYGVLEILIGLFCMVLPVLLGAAAPVYGAVYRAFDGTSVWLHLIRAITCGLVLLVPTTCMGATLPLLLRHFVRRQDTLGWTVGLVYAINTFGAVAGCVLTGFLLLPALGLSKTVGIAVFVNIAVGVVAIVFLEERRRAEAGPAKASEAEVADESPGKSDGATFSSWESRAALLAFGISGVAAMIDEVALTRAFSMVLGSSTYAFSLMLTAFILGIGLGSIVLARWVKPGRDLVLGVGVTQWAIGVSTLFMGLMIGQLPQWIVGLIGRHRSSFASIQVLEFLYLFLIMLVPTCLMGLMFPLVTSIWTRRPENVGRSSGQAYFVNTVGAILGSLLGGFVLLPILGVQKSLLAAALLNLVNAAAVFASHGRWDRRVKLGLAGGALAAGLVLLGLVPAWNLDELTSGPYLYASAEIKPGETAREALDRELRRQGEIVWTKDGTACTVTVKKTRDNVVQLLVNGKADASSQGDVVTQKLAGHIPMMLHPNPRKALVIGLGCGMTLASALTHEPDRADCVEISREVVYAAQEYFAEFTDDCLNNPRTRLIIGDGRNHVALTDQTYDVISSEPSNPWIAGIGNLFTEEFWALCRARLSSSGIMCQWVQSYQVDLRTFRLILRTFRSVFPDCTVWIAQPFDFLLIGSKQPLRIDLETLRERLARPKVSADLKLSRIENVETFLSHFVTDRDGVEKLAGTGELHTDDNVRLEFDMPRHMYTTKLDVYLELDPEVRPALSILTETSVSAETEAALARAHERKWHLQLSHILKKAGRYDDAVARLEQVFKLDASDPEGLFELFDLLRRRARVEFEAEQFGRARTHLERLLELYPAIADLAASDRAGVRALFEGISSLDDVYAELASNLGEVLRIVGLREDSPEDLAQSVEAFRFALARDPDYTRANTNLGALLVLTKEFADAVPYLSAAMKAEPESAGLWLNLGAAHEGKGGDADARKCYEEALRLDPQSAGALLRLGLLHERQGRGSDAIKCYESLLKLRPRNRAAGERLRALREKAADQKRLEASRPGPSLPPVHGKASP